MGELVRLSALGRCVKPGDLYNYFNDDILNDAAMTFQMFQFRQITCNTPPKTEHFFFFQQQPDKYKRVMLGINSHLQHNIERKFLDFNRLWFANYLSSSPPEDNVAEVAVFFRIVHTTESIDQKFINLNLFDYQIKSGGQATHLVKEVDYGVELICSMSRTFDPSHEKKEDIEKRMYTVAKLYFDQQVNTREWSESPTELAQVYCRVTSSVEPSRVKQGSFQQSCVLIKEAICHPTIFQPINIVLRLIPFQMEARMLFEKIEDIKNSIEINWVWILKENYRLAGHSVLDRILPLKNALRYFSDSLGPLPKSVIEIFFVKTIIESCSLEEFLGSIRTIKNLLAEMTDWLKQRRKEIEIINWLLRESKFEMSDLKDIETEAMKSNGTCFKVFILKIDYKEDQLINRIRQMIRTLAPSPDYKLPDFTFTSAGMDRLKTMDALFQAFSTEANQCSSAQRIYKIGLVSASSPYEDGTIKTVEYPHKSLPGVCLLDGQLDLDKKLSQPESPDISKSPLSVKLSPVRAINFNRLKKLLHESVKLHQLKLEKHDSRIETESGCAENVNGDLKDTVENDKKTEIVQTIDQLVDSFAGVNIENETSVDSTTAEIERRPLEQSSTIQEYEVASKAIMSDNKEYHLEQIVQPISDVKTNSDQVQQSPVYNNESSIDLVTHRCRTDGNLCSCQLVKQDNLKIYLLDAIEKSASAEFRWFEIGKPNNVIPALDHKVIILIGATGSGKSTLINGMVNYVLGVQWRNSFRFKVIQEDEPDQNEAHSQTNSVTAYTLHHHSGMVVPYSVTIIDTPGYGDTRGVGRDVEITRKIHRFLTKPEYRIDKIHAVCFVAASSDSRPTITQRYIIDSVLSTFGENVKDNFRLLVTFADSANPPVVETYKAAHFPVTSKSVAMTYHKFNNSILFSSNHKQEENDSSFDKFFWDMGQENYQNFFTMLEGMSGCCLPPKRELIHRHVQLNNSLKLIELELEICLADIENMKMFQKKIIEHGHKMDFDPNDLIKITQIISREEYCKKGFQSYNCCYCKKTCELPSVVTNFKKRPCNNILCKCLAVEHKFQSFVWRPIPEKINGTLLRMKAYYEWNCSQKLTTEQLIAKIPYELDLARAKVINLLDQLKIENYTPSDYLIFMRNQVIERQALDYVIRLETLMELQKTLATDFKVININSRSICEQAF